MWTPPQKTLDLGLEEVYTKYDGSSSYSPNSSSLGGLGQLLIKNKIVTLHFRMRGQSLKKTQDRLC